MRIPQSPTELGFNRDDRQRLHKALRQVSDKRTFRRLQAVSLVAQGRGVHEVADIIGVSAQAVYRWLDGYLRSHQVEALYEQQRSGRPRVAAPITAARLLRELRRNPLRLGYYTTVWTVELLAGHLTERYGCQISPRTLRRRMKQIGLRCKRPRYVYAEKDPHRAQKKGRLSGG
jgi:transposase